ncbi:MAG: hypothetical protein ACT4OK_13240 [Gemmobacter sp.]
MAYFTTTAPARLTGLVSRILHAAGEAVWLLANSGSMAEDVRRLNALSDADLAARGTTRAAEVQRIFGPRSLL